MPTPTRRRHKPAPIPPPCACCPDLLPGEEICPARPPRLTGHFRARVRMGICAEFRPALTDPLPPPEQERVVWECGCEGPWLPVVLVRAEAGRYLGACGVCRGRSRS